MSVKSFKFVSPGVFINEIDNSQLPRLPDQLGPVLIGRSERGPSMVPVQVDSFSEFVEVFGEPIGGGESEDTWRNGNRMGPTYAAFAAQAYLNSSSPVTFVRLLGTESTAADAEGKAGWEMDEASVITLTGTNGGETPYAILYHKTGVTVATEKTGLKEFQITLSGAGSSSSSQSASRTLTIDPEFSNLITAAQLDDAAVETQISFTIAGKEDDDTTVTFTMDLQSQYTGSSLKVGLAGGVSPERVAEKIAEAINSVGDSLTASATANGRVVTIISDTGGQITPADGVAAKHHVVTALANVSLGDNNTAVLVIGGIDQNGADAVDASAKTFTVSVDPNSKKYIRSVLNTNPTLTNEDITSAPEKYFLGPTFDQALNRVISFTNEAGIDDAGVAVADGGESLKKFRVPASPACTPWILSQSLSDPAQFNRDDLTQLFKIHALYSGEWEQKNFKVSITDISTPRNSYTKYGTFSLEIRRVSDSDSNPQVVERFTGLTLDPASPSYIGAKIGDMKLVWEEEEGRYVEYGTHKNVSKFIRVQVATDVATGAANPELLPFGFDVMKDPSGPNLCLRLSTKGSSKLSQSSDAYFGITSDKTDSGDDTQVAFEVTDSSYCDMVRTISTDSLTVQELFTLDFIKVDDKQYPCFPTTGNDATKAQAAINQTGDYAAVLGAIDKFTVPLQGGMDGLNITEIEPFNSSVLNESATPTSSYAYYSIKRAIDSVSDPEFVECNMMSIPGVSNPGLTGQLIDVCEKRADALAVIDLEDDYCPAGWDLRPEENRLPKVDDALRNLRDRAINSSYGCAYYPWVQIRDNIGNKLVWVPPSVAAIGTMSSAAANSELWFAPAGFTRGGLTAGAAGLPVIQTRYRLSSKQRDRLYEANVNPIAQFPAEGIVIFGQKTLQVTPSALDRINVRRLMIFVKKEISRMASTLLFDQNVDVTWSRFKSKAEPFLTSVKARFGLTEYRIILDETTTTPDLIDRNIMYAKIFLKPARAIEFIAIDFVITNSGASFDD